MEIKVLKSNIGDSQAGAGELEAELISLREIVRTKSEALQITEKEGEELSEKFVNLEVENDSVKKEVSDKRSEIEKIETKLEKTISDLEKNRSKLKNSEVALESKVKELSESKLELESREKEIESSKTELENLVTKNMELVEKLSDKENTVKNNDAKKSDSESQLAQMKKEYRQLKKIKNLFQPTYVF